MSWVLAALIRHSRPESYTVTPVRLFTPLTDAQADQAERGALYGDSFVWVDDPQRVKAEQGSIWVAIDVPDTRLGKFEQRQGPQLGYREFVLPVRMTNLHRAERVQLPSE